MHPDKKVTEELAGEPVDIYVNDFTDERFEFNLKFHPTRALLEKYGDERGMIELRMRLLVPGVTSECSGGDCDKIDT